MIDLCVLLALHFIYFYSIINVRMESHVLPRPTMKSDFSMASILLDIEQHKSPTANDIHNLPSQVETTQLPCKLESYQLSCKLENQLESSQNNQLSTCKVESMKDHEWLNKKQESGELNQNTREIMAPDEKIRVSLDDKDLWTSFHRLTNEMIVTKNGRYVVLGNSHPSHYIIFRSHVCRLYSMCFFV